MKNRTTTYLLPLSILSNLFPLYGVIMYDWTIFSVVYIYWIELLIISTFQLLKILLAQGDINAGFKERAALAFKFFAFRTGIFFFYLLFIIVFLGFMVSSKERGAGLNVFRIMTFQDAFFKIALLSFVVYNLVEFIVRYLATGKYKSAKPADYYSMFDARIIVVHIVVVLGTFLYQLVLDKLNADHKTAMIACVSLFIIVKLIADTIKHSVSPDDSPEDTAKYI
ncbi:MAG: DUF6498-containing protein [Chitinophagales bacterium]